MPIYKKRLITGLGLVLLLSLILTGCSGNILFTGYGRIVLHLSSNGAANTTSLMNSAVVSSTDSVLPRTTARVLSLLKGYRVRVKGNNENIIRDAFFSDGQTEVSLTISVPAGSGYKVQILALGEEINFNASNKRLLLGGGEAADVQVSKDEDNFVKVLMEPYKFDFSDNPEETAASSPFNVSGTISGPLVSEVLDLSETELYYYRADQIEEDFTGENVSALNWEPLDAAHLRFSKDISGLSAGPFYFQLAAGSSPSWEYNGASFLLTFPLISTGESDLLPLISIEDNPVNQPPVIALTTAADGMTAALSGSVTDNDRAVEEVLINWGDGSIDTLVSGFASISETHIYPIERDYTITVSATDDRQAAASEEYPVTIQLPPPLNSNMVNVPAGTTSPDNGEITLDYSIEMGKYEVTHGEYITFLNSAGITADGIYNDQVLIDLADSNCAVGYEEGFYFKGSGEAAAPECPVMEVSWYGLLVYCNWLSEQEGLTPAYDLDNWDLIDPDPTALEGYRLPTETEWEYTARGGANGEPTEYAGSSDINEAAWYFYNSDTGSGRQSHPVGLKEPNELGIYDMSGNIGEWTNTPDDYHEGYYIVRGGDWKSTEYCKVSNDEAINEPDYSIEYIGFRLTRSK